jgi:hypothetical protein
VSQGMTKPGLIPLGVANETAGGRGHKRGGPKRPPLLQLHVLQPMYSPDLPTALFHPYFVFPNVCVGSSLGRTEGCCGPGTLPSSPAAPR